MTREVSPIKEYRPDKYAKTNFITDENSLLNNSVENLKEIEQYEEEPIVEQDSIYRQDSPLPKSSRSSPEEILEHNSDVIEKVDSPDIAENTIKSSASSQSAVSKRASPLVAPQYTMMSDENLGQFQSDFERNMALLGIGNSSKSPTTEQKIITESKIPQAEIEVPVFEKKDSKMNFEEEENIKFNLEDPLESDNDSINTSDIFKKTDISGEW